MKAALYRLLPAPLFTVFLAVYHRIKLRAWQRAGQPLPPPHSEKARVITAWQKRTNYTTLIETGTFMGDMVLSQRQYFKRIFSIELDQALFQRATTLFKNDPAITIVQGDSGAVLPAVLTEVSEPCIFWLDGHYSAGVTAKGSLNCPIFAELEAIFEASPEPHVLLIDDARLFIGEDDYPTKDELVAFIAAKNKNYICTITSDVFAFYIA